MVGDLGISREMTGTKGGNYGLQGFQVYGWRLGSYLS